MWTLFDKVLWLCAKVLWLAVPVMLAAGIHVVVIRLDWPRQFKKPIDFGLTLRGRRLFGDNKTWRGALVMVTVSSVGMVLQQLVQVRTLELFDYGGVNAWLCGAALGVGFVLAELPNSFLKRQFDVPPGHQATGRTYWLFTTLDQVDSVVGCLVALAFVWLPSWQVILATLVLCSFVHIAFNLVFVALGLKRRAL